MKMLGMVPVQALKPSNWDVRVLTMDGEERLKREVRGPEHQPMLAVAARGKTDLSYLKFVREKLIKKAKGGEKA
jgi:hypothetical protein